MCRRSREFPLNRDKLIISKYILKNIPTFLVDGVAPGLGIDEDGPVAHDDDVGDALVVAPVQVVRQVGLLVGGGARQAAQVGHGLVCLKWTKN